jgi:hypothetical protein
MRQLLDRPTVDKLLKQWESAAEEAKVEAKKMEGFGCQGVRAMVLENCIIDLKKLFELE